MTELREGQRVHVAYDGVVVYSHRSNDGLVEVRADAHNFSNSIHCDYITPSDPANWPPQVGDIWEADGLEYFVRESRRDSAKLFLTSASAESNDYMSYELDRFKALNPTLVRRRDAVVLQVSHYDE